MNQNELNNNIAVASMRLAAIQPAFNNTYPDMTKKAYYDRISKQPFKFPDGHEVLYSPGTFACWESDFRKGGFDALIPKERSDKGHTRKLDADVIAKIYDLREKYPRLTATGIRDKMIMDGFIKESDASVATFQRFIKKNNLKGASAPGQKDRKAFEEEFATGMYQADTLYGPFITENGISKRTYCIMILDDKSRMIVGGKFFYQDNSVNFLHVFKEAVASYGIPQKLYVDNGASYKNSQLPLICGQLGTILIHTPVRDGASKGKVERNFRTLRTRFLDALDPASVASIGELNRLLVEYIRTHNTSEHSGTGMIPHTRYMEDIFRVKMPKSREWLNDCFLYRVKRKVRNDSTILLEKQMYDVPMEYIRCCVEIRYIPGDTDSVFIYEKDKRISIRLTDKVENSKTKRNKQYSLTYGGNNI